MCESEFLSKCFRLLTLNLRTLIALTVYYVTETYVYLKSLSKCQPQGRLNGNFVTDCEMCVHPLLSLIKPQTKETKTESLLNEFEPLNVAKADLMIWLIGS